MPDKWIQDRFDKFQAKLAADQQRQQWNNKARQSYDAHFDALKSRVEQDIDAYNQLFSKVQDCKATFIPAHENGFAAACKGNRVLLEKTNSSIIKIYWGGGLGIAPDKSDTLEIVADDVGEVRYKHGKTFLADVSDASQMILDPVLCA
jgi:hypothetical protein